MSTTHGVTTVRAYCEDMLRYTNVDTANQITWPDLCHRQRDRRRIHRPGQDVVRPPDLYETVPPIH